MPLRLLRTGFGSAACCLSPVLYLAARRRHEGSNRCRRTHGVWFRCRGDTKRHGVRRRRDAGESACVRSGVSSQSTRSGASRSDHRGDRRRDAGWSHRHRGHRPRASSKVHTGHLHLRPIGAWRAVTGCARRLLRPGVRRSAPTPALAPRPATRRDLGARERSAPARRGRAATRSSR